MLLILLVVLRRLLRHNGLWGLLTGWIGQRVLRRDLIVLQHRFKDLHALLIVLRLEQLADFEDLALHLLVLVIQDEPGLDGLDLCLEEAEGIGVCDIETSSHINGQLFIRFAQLVAPMSIRAVLAEVALLLLLEVLAHLRLVVVVRDVQHLILHFDGKLLSHTRRTMLDSLKGEVESFSINCRSCGHELN